MTAENARKRVQLGANFRVFLQAISVDSSDLLVLVELADAAFAHCIDNTILENLNLLHSAVAARYDSLWGP